MSLIPGEELLLGELLRNLVGDGDSAGGVLGCSGGVGGARGSDSGSLSGDSVGSKGSYLPFILVITRSTFIHILTNRTVIWID